MMTHCLNTIFKAKETSLKLSEKTIIWYQPRIIKTNNFHAIAIVFRQIESLENYNLRLLYLFMYSYHV